MKKQFVIIGIMLILFAVGYIGCDSGGGSGSGDGSSGNVYEFTESFDQEYQTESITSILVSTTNGRIKIMGWDEETGVPTNEKLAELGIDWVAELLGK